jgi:hypothetical protein
MHIALAAGQVVWTICFLPAATTGWDCKGQPDWTSQQMQPVRLLGSTVPVVPSALRAVFWEPCNAPKILQITGK